MQTDHITEMGRVNRLATEKCAHREPALKRKPLLVVVPPNVVHQWADKIANITDLFSVYTYYGDNRKQSDAALYNIKVRLTRDHHIFDRRLRKAKAVVITSYQTLASPTGRQQSKHGLITKRSPSTQTCLICHMAYYSHPLDCSTVLSLMKLIIYAILIRTCR